MLEKFTLKLRRDFEKKLKHPRAWNSGGSLRKSTLLELRRCFEKVLKINGTRKNEKEKMVKNSGARTQEGLK